MDYFSAKINQLVVENPEVKKSLVRSFISRPPKELEKVKGKLFGLIEIESTNSKILDLINLIIEEIKTNYYSRREEKSISLEAKFESALQKTNSAINIFLETEQIILDLEKINILIGVMANKELYFTQVGNLNIFLFQYLKKGEYRIIDILEVTKTPKTPLNPLKIFSQVISGKINPRDILFLTTPNLLDYFSLEKIKNIITGQQSVTDGSIQLKKLLQDLNQQKNFGAVVLEIERAVASITKPLVAVQDFDYRKAADRDSMKELIKTEKETEKLLTPSVLPEIKKYTVTFKKAFQTYLTKIKDTSIKTTKIIPLPKFKIDQKLSKNLPSLQNLTKPLKGKIKNLNLPIKLYPIRKKLTYFIKSIIGRLSSVFSRLPVSGRIFLIVSVIFAILFIQSVIWLGIKNQREKKLEQFNQTILAAEKSKNEAEASLIYRDEDKARELLVTAKNSLTELKPKSKTQKEQIEILVTAIEKQLQNLRHIIEIPEPTLIVNFQNLDSQADIVPLLVRSGSAVYTQNHHNQSVYKADLNSRIISGIYSETVNTGNFSFGITVSNNEIIFLNESRQAFSLNPNNNNIKNLTFNIVDQADITDLASYNNRLYLVDKANNQIYRYSKIVNGYGNTRDWLDDDRVSLNQAVSLTIDGSLYVLKSNGEIIKLERGEKVDFDLALIDPLLQSPTKIKTTDSSDYLYILDPPTKRLVVLDKEGRLINQYTSEQFNNLKDFIVDEREKKIYLLNDSSIFGIPVEHL